MKGGWFYTGWGLYSWLIKRRWKHRLERSRNRRIGERFRTLFSSIAHAHYILLKSVATGFVAIQGTYLPVASLLILPWPNFGYWLFLRRDLIGFGLQILAHYQRPVAAPMA